MLRRVCLFGLSLLTAGIAQPALCINNDMLLSVAKPSGQALARSKPVPSPEAKAATARGSAAKAPAKNDEKPAAKAAAGSSGKGQTSSASSAGGEQGDEQDAAATAAPPPATAQLLTQAYDAFRASGNPAALGEVMRLFKQLLSQAGAKTPAAALIKSSPALAELGAKALDAGSGRVWVFSKLPDRHEVIVQWTDSKPMITFVGRRHRIRKVSYAITRRIGSLTLPPTITLQQARILGSAEGSHSIVLVGAERGSSLWLKTFKQTEGGWAETASRLDSIPAFLTNNVSGKVGFRGADLIFNVGRVVPAHVEGVANNLPEAESATYRFWLKLTDEGYVLMPQLPDENQFAPVRAFLDALANARTDIAKSLLTDGRLVSIPKYVGVRGPSSSFRVAQMASPPSGAPRFRLVTGGKDDLIFEVVRIKEKPMIRAIFIAPPDPFLQEIAGQFPTYDKVGVQATAAADPAASDKH